MNRLLQASQPTEPRIAFWSTPTLWPSDSKNHIFAARALLSLGQHRFREEWESSHCFVELKRELPTALTLYTDIAEVRRGRILLYDDNYTIEDTTTDEEHPFPTTSMWHEAVARAKQEADASWRQYAHFLKSAFELAEACKWGSIKTATRPVPGGELSEKQWHFWNTERAWLRFETCRIREDDPFSMEPVVAGGAWIFVEQSSFEKHLKGERPEARDQAVTENQLKVAARESRPRGRPRVYEWDQLLIMLCNFTYSGVVTKETPTRTIAEMLADRISEVWEKIPDVKTIEEKVADWRLKFGWSD